MRYRQSDIIKIISLLALFSIPCHAWNPDSTGVWGLECGTSQRWIDSLGCSWGRIFFTTSAWGTIQPTSLDSFEFENLDREIIELDSVGANILMTLITGGPTHVPCNWVDTTYEPDIGIPLLETEHMSCPPLDLDDWSNFVYTVVERYDGFHINEFGDSLPEIRYFEAQAEANNGYWYGTKEEYWDELMPSFYNAVHSANPRAKVVGGSNLGESCINWTTYRMAHPYSGTPYPEDEILDFINRGYEWYSGLTIWYSLAALESYWTEPGPTRVIEFIEYSFSHDSLYDLRGVHNYNHYSTIPVIAREERLAMAHYGEIKPFFATETGGMGCFIGTGLEQQTEGANRIAKKMIFHYVEGFEVITFFASTGAWTPLGCVMGLTNLGLSLREAAYSWLLITRLLPGYDVRVFDHKEHFVGGEDRYFFRQTGADVGDWDVAVAFNDSLDSTETVSAFLPIPAGAETVVVYNYLGDSTIIPSPGDSLALDIGILPLFIRLVGDGTAIVESRTPREYEIRIFPSPFNSSVTISLSIIPGPTRNPEIEIYDIDGRMVAQIPANNPVGDGSPVPPTKGRGDRAPTEIVWTPDAALASGVYLVRARFGGESVSKRIVYLK